jgi:hypothetical protein
MDMDTLIQIQQLQRRIEHLEMYETINSQVWDDLRIEPTARGTGAKTPVYIAYKTSMYLYAFDDAAAAAEKELNFKMQMPHSWKQGTAVHMHVHWLSLSTGNPNEVVRWGFEYCVANINAVFPATATIYATAPYSPPSTTPTIDTHYLTEFAEISMTGKTVSCIMLGRIFRNSSNAADTFTGTAGLVSIDAHYQLDSLGSSSELTK